MIRSRAALVAGVVAVMFGFAACLPIPQGAYVGPANPAGISSFAKASGTHPTIASDYLPASSGWSGMDGANGSLSWLFAQGWDGKGYTLSLGGRHIHTPSRNTPMGSVQAGSTGT